MIGPENSTYTVGEGDGSIEICVVILSVSLERAVLINLTSEDGSAIGMFATDGWAMHGDISFSLQMVLTMPGFRLS